MRYSYDAGKRDETSWQFKAVVPYTLNPSSYAPERNLLLRNDGGRFTEVGHEAGVDNPAGRSLSASWADFNDDGWPDLYVANDVSDNAMFLNLGNGRLTLSASASTTGMKRARTIATSSSSSWRVSATSATPPGSRTTAARWDSGSGTGRAGSWTRPTSSASARSRST